MKLADVEVPDRSATNMTSEKKQEDMEGGIKNRFTCSTIMLQVSG